MFFKFLWFLVLVWILGRVFKSALSIFRIASGQVPPAGSQRVPWPGAGMPGSQPQRPSGPEVIRPSAPAAAPQSTRKDVEDARFEDLP